jgi:pyrimidine-specific ribonucleoside hydrolase
MKTLFSIIVLLFFSVSLHSHPWKPSHYVIIDTDGGIDDLRAVSLLLASPDVRVLAITVSQGALTWSDAYIKVKSLLNSYFHEGIPVAVNRNSSFRSPGFRVALDYKWGDEAGLNPENAPDIGRVISEIISAEKTKISFICLGGMSTASTALQTIPDFRKQVKDFIWSANGADDKAGFNYNIDKNASVAMLKQEIPVKIIRKFSLSGDIFYDEALISSVDSVKTTYGKKLKEFFRSQQVREHNFAFSATDEMTALFLQYPDVFIVKTMGNISDCTPSDEKGLRKNFIKILKGETVLKNQVIRDLPADPTFYFEDISKTVTEIIDKYGQDEWTSGVIANELHRHLGVFAIIGVKMGIRAREYFDTGVDEFRVRSFAGSEPPVSCFNDGLQVSTGATPGHGLLTVINDQPVSPSAEFTYLNRKIKLTLKPEITSKITSELKEINFVYGLDSNTYWELVRKNSIKYWLSMDRHEIFNIEVL